jgi:hypothetical protein
MRSVGASLNIESHQHIKRSMQIQRSCARTEIAL